jgi:hypothetical protein
MTPSRTTARAWAAVFRQEIFEGSKAPIGSASSTNGADIGSYSFQLFVLGQHFHAGVNEWLTIRHSLPEFFKWLLFGRCEP